MIASTSVHESALMASRPSRSRYGPPGAVTSPLAEIERRFDPRRFLRLDASHVVNVTRIAELIP